MDSVHKRCRKVLHAAQSCCHLLGAAFLLCEVEDESCNSRFLQTNIKLPLCRLHGLWGRAAKISEIPFLSSPRIHGGAQPRESLHSERTACKDNVPVFKF